MCVTCVVCQCRFRLLNLIHSDLGCQGECKEQFGDVEDETVATVFCNGCRGKKEWVGWCLRKEEVRRWLIIWEIMLEK